MIVIIVRGLFIYINIYSASRRNNMYVKREVTQEDLDNIRINLSVRELKLRPEPSCDFCGNVEPKYIYAAIRMSTGEWVSNWRWLACMDCSSCVDKNKWKPIEDKVIRYLRSKGFAAAGDKELRDAARMSIAQFLLYAERD